MIHVYTGVFPVHDKMKRATVGPLPGVTQDIAGYKVRLLGQYFLYISVVDTFFGRQFQRRKRKAAQESKGSTSG